MWQCSSCKRMVADEMELCIYCGNGGRNDDVLTEAADLSFLDPESRLQERAQQRVADRRHALGFSCPGLIVTTTTSIENRAIADYVGIVFGHAIRQTTFFEDLQDTFQSRSIAYESMIANCRVEALTDMSRRAISLGANAIVGVRVDYETIRSSHFAVHCNGTAVRLVDPE